MQRKMKKGKIVEENAGFSEDEAKKHLDEMERLTQAIVDIFDPRQPFYKRILGLKEHPKRVDWKLAIASVTIAGVAIAKKAGLKKEDYLAAARGAWESTHHKYKRDES